MADDDADLAAIAEYYETHELTEDMSAEPAEPQPSTRHFERARHWEAVGHAERGHQTEKSTR